MILVNLLSNKREDFRHSPLTLPLLLFIGIALLSTAVGILTSYLTLNDVLGAVRTIINYLTFFIVLYLCREKYQLRRLFNGIILAATLVTVIMIIQFLAGPSLRLLAGRIEVLYTEGATNLGATRIIPPGYPLISIAFISLTVSFFLDDFRNIQFASVLQWVLIGIGVLITYKRHIWGVVALSTIIIFFIVPGQKKLKLFFISQILILLVALAAFLLVQFAPASKPAILVESSIARAGSLFQSSTYEENSSLRWRDFEYHYAIPQIIGHPLLGLGLGAIYRPFVPHRDNESYDGRRFIHNGHIAIMVKIGLPAYLLFLWVSIAFLSRGFKHWRMITDPILQKIYIGFTLSFLGLFLGSVIEPMIVEWDCTALLGIMMGMNEAILLHNDQKTASGGNPN